MEAKGCAKPMVWKNARRYFFWALRARLARSSALSRIGAAAPNSTLEYRTRLLKSLLPDMDSGDNRDIAIAFEGLNLDATLEKLQSDTVVKEMLAIAQKDHKAATEGILRVADLLSDDEKAALIASLQATRSGEFNRAFQT